MITMINWKDPLDVAMAICMIIASTIVCIAIVIIIIVVRNCTPIQVYINDGQQQIIKKDYWIKNNVEDIEIYIQYPDGTLHKYIPENKENAA